AAPSAAAPATPVPAIAAPPPVPPQTLAQKLAADKADLANLASQAAITSNDGRLAAFGQSAAAIEAEARADAAPPAAGIAQLQAKLAKIAPKRGRRLTAAERAKEAPLLAQLAPLEAEYRQARAVVSAAKSTFSFIAERRREGFSARVLTRSQTPASPQFWTALASAAGGDGARLYSMADDAVDVAQRAAEPQAVLMLAGALVVALALVLPVRLWLERLGRRKTSESAHPGLSRTASALWVAALDVGAPTLGVALLQLAAQWGGLLSAQADAMAGAAVVAAAWASGIMALGRVLATDADPRRRLLPLPDEDARRLRLPMLIVAVVTGVGFLLSRLNYVVGASVAATIATNCVLSLAYAAVAGLIVVSFGRGRTRPVEGEQAEEHPPAPAWTLISLLLSAAIALTVGAVFAGYSTLAAMTSGQIFWLSIIASGAYLFMRFFDDLCAATFSQRGWASRLMSVLFSFRRSTIAQAGALVSAAAQIVIILAAISLALTPFGRGGSLLFSHLGQLGAPIKIGSATISPGAIAAGIATFVVGMGAVRLVQGWVVRRYLPVTDWDSGVRNSVTTGVGYIGVAVALLCALAAMGLGLSQIALVASALSVGIGFGLQQVVQNFVSGVILLVERPVKVGDRVNIGGVEGDVRRIRVRATEIQVADRSTVIVPNSDLITKQVQNKTLGAPRSRVQLQLSVTHPEDVTKARDAILAVVRAKPAVAKEPPAEVFIESLAAGGAVNLTCYLYVVDVRQAYRVRSECYFEILAAFQKETIAFAGAA
ncbi:MAG: DUF3772 domain-containing protein, partial [Caulobacteraceae bacterium]